MGEVRGSKHCSQTAVRCFHDQGDSSPITFHTLPTCERAPLSNYDNDKKEEAGKRG